MVKKIIPLEHYLAIIPEADFQNPDFKGVKFRTIYNEFVRLGIKGARRTNKVREDLDYYVQLGFFGRIHDDKTHKQPIFYQTHIGGDLVTDTGLQNGIKFAKSLLDEHFKKIETEWKKLDKEKLFLKNKKTKRGNPIPSKKFDRWIMLFDHVIVITQNLMWTRETMDYYTFKDDYSKLITYSIKELNKCAKKVYSANEKTKKGVIDVKHKQGVIDVFARFPFRINF